MTLADELAAALDRAAVDNGVAGEAAAWLDGLHIGDRLGEPLSEWRDHTLTAVLDTLVDAGHQDLADELRRFAAGVLRGMADQLDRAP